MSARQSLTTTQSQRLSLTSGLRHGMSLLQMGALDVWAEISRAAADNPLLDYDTNDSRRLPDFDAAMRSISEAETLAQSLVKQVALMDLPRPVTLLAQYLAAELSQEGYLEQSDEDISDALDLPLVQIEQAISALQNCEPTGVGARNLGECLALQLMEKGVPAQAAHVACAHLDLLVEQQWRRAHRNTGLSIEALQDIAELLPGLNPHPAQDHAPLAAQLIPEVEVELDRGGLLQVSLIRDMLPSLQLDDRLLAQMSRGNPLLKQFRPAAQNMISGLNFRNETLLQVAGAIVHSQAAFFTKGPDHMAPLSRRDLAASIGVHASTVGRAIAKKALLFNGVTYPLTHFISASLSDGALGKVSAYSVQRTIRRLIEHEQPDAPLSDNEIAALLHIQGVDIARRTVAKYRGCMNIPSSFERGRLGAMRRNRPIAPDSGSPD